jgi:hypothetical protein
MNMDGWFYMAGGHFLHEWGRIPYQGSDLLLQFGSYYREHRFATFCLLSHLSALTGNGDVFAVGGLFQAWALFTTAAAVGLFWLARGHSFTETFTGIGLTAVAGWTANVVWGNWFEQELALPYMPAIAAAFYLWGASNWRRWAVLGVLTAGMLYTYPEAAMVPLGAAGLIALCRLWYERASWKAWLAGAPFTLALAALLLSPALPTLIAFTKGQNASVYTQNVEGVRWLVGGLENSRSHPGAFWGLGGETFAKPATLAGNHLGAALSVCAFAGMVVLACRREWGVAASAAGLTLAAAGWLVVLHHPYITFKTLILGWWLLFYVAAVGAVWVVSRLPAPLSRRWLAGAGITMMLGIGLWETQKREPLGTTRYPELHLHDYRALDELRTIVGSEPLLVHVHDWLASQLAISRLHDHALYLAAPRGWYAGPGVAQHRQGLSPGISPDIRLVLTDREYDTCRVSDLALCARAVWSGGPYTLWRLEPECGPSVALLNIDPLVTDVMDGTAGKTFWIGHEKITLHLTARAAGTLCMTTEVCLGDGSVEGKRHLTISTDAGQVGQVEVAAGPGAIRIPVHSGLNRVVLDCPDAPPAAGRVSGIAHRYILCLREARLTLNDHCTDELPIRYEMVRRMRTQEECACVFCLTP